MSKKKYIAKDKYNNIWLLLILVIGLIVGLIALRSPKLIGSKAAGTKPTCTGSWTCSKGISTGIYQCSLYAGGTEALCNGGGNGQGNYCVFGYTRTGGCTYSTGAIPTPTPTTGSTFIFKPTPTPTIRKPRPSPTTKLRPTPTPTTVPRTYPPPP